MNNKSKKIYNIIIKNFLFILYKDKIILILYIQSVKSLIYYIEKILQLFSERINMFLHYE